MAAYPLMYLHLGCVYRVYVDLTNAESSFLLSLFPLVAISFSLVLFLVIVLQSIDTIIICKITVVLRGSTTFSSDSS